MDFALSPALEALRSEVCDFLAREVPPDHPEPHLLPESGTDEQWEFARALSRKLAEKGWRTATWPKEIGGLGWGPLEALVMYEEMSYHGVARVGFAGTGVVVQFANDEQRKRFLPGMAAADVIWGEGYSEPEAGSDLAALRTVAVRDGDEYVINGTKIWQVGGPRLDWMFVFARTDTEAPPRRGLSYLLVDMNSPGITRVAVPSLTGVPTFGQEFFENVRVPASNLLGDEHAGWQMRGQGGGDGMVATGLDSPSKMRRHLEHLVAECRQAPGQEGKPYDDPLIRQKLAQAATEIELAYTLLCRNSWLASRRELTLKEGGALGIFQREVNQRLARSAVNILGLYGPLLAANERWVKLSGWFADSYLYTLAAGMYGGTTEIQRDLLAQRGLGLPRA